jgi:hypothetical protein
MSQNVDHDKFVEVLEGCIKEHKGSLLDIPGVYEACSEYFNNEVLKRIREEQQERYEYEGYKR